LAVVHQVLLLHTLRLRPLLPPESQWAGPCGREGLLIHSGIHRNRVGREDGRSAPAVPL